MTTFSECFNTILTADKEASRQAARQVRKILYSSKSDGQFDVIKSIIETAPQKYENITEDWRQENFVMAVRMLENELGPLTVHIRCSETKSSKDKFLIEQSDIILSALYDSLISLAENWWKPVYKRYKYVDSLPTGQYKSIQMVLGCMKDYCGKNYQ